MKLKMTINKIKSIDHLTIDLPVEKGLYALTGQNGAGKSTVATCASSVFFNMQMNDYFGVTPNDSYINFEYNGASKEYKKKPNPTRNRYYWTSNGNIRLKGFYEGSLIFGNRFRNTNYNNLRKLERINESYLEEAPEFVRKNLGIILHNNENFYKKLYKVNARVIDTTGQIFYYQIGEKKVSQFHMSTGENLLISILNSLNIRNSDRQTIDTPCLLLLDEIELALHPSSLKRLVVFLKEISNEYNYAVYFSTHSIELISSIKPDNIFFLERHSDRSVELINPCYPAYATRMLYDYGSGYDYIILVEDDLAKEIVMRLLKKNSLLSNKLIHVLPCGGYGNVIDLAQEVVSSNLVGKNAKIIIILDADIRKHAEKYIAKNNISNNIPLNYLPLECLEKYLRTKLFVNVDHKLFRELNDCVFHQKSLREIISEYRNSEEAENDVSGKKMYERIDSELRARNKTRNEIIEFIVEYLMDNDSDSISKIINFLKKQLSL